MKGVAFVVVAALAGFAGSAQAGISGFDLNTACSATVSKMEANDDRYGFEEGLCFGVVATVADMIETIEAGSESSRKLCIPKYVTNAHLVRVVEDYIRGHADYLNGQATTITYGALIDAYPCK